MDAAEHFRRDQPLEFAAHPWAADGIQLIVTACCAETAAKSSGNRFATRVNQLSDFVPADVARYSASHNTLCGRLISMAEAKLPGGRPSRCSASSRAGNAGRLAARQRRKATKTTVMSSAVIFLTAEEDHRAKAPRLPSFSCNSWQHDAHPPASHSCPCAHGKVREFQPTRA